MADIFIGGKRVANTHYFTLTWSESMQLVPGQNNKDCMGAAFASTTYTTLKDVQLFCMHDGSNGYTNQEMVDYALSKGYAAVGHWSEHAYTNEAPKVDLERRIKGRKGVIGLQIKGKNHAVATDGTTVYDPKGTAYPLEHLLEYATLIVFWQIEKICSCKNA